MLSMPSSVAIVTPAADDASGGPVKPFLDHLEDVRWVLIRFGVAIALGLLLALMAARQITGVLVRPLEQAREQLAAAVVSHPAGVAWREENGAFTVRLSGLEAARLGLPPSTTGGRLVRLAPVRVNDRILLGVEPVGGPWKLDHATGVPQLEQRGPLTPFFLAMQTALYAGLGLALPFVLYFAGSFLLPALRGAEKRLLFHATFWAAVLFLLGVLVAHQVLAQITVRASLQFSGWLGISPGIWFVDDYVAQLLQLIFGVGLAFEVPVVLLSLVRLGVLNHARLAGCRPYWMIANLVLAGILTPPDVVSQLLLAVPLQALFEVSVLIAWWWERNDRANLGNPESPPE